MERYKEAFQRNYWILYEEFYKNISYSYWKLIDGNNHYIIWDQDVSGKYYVFSDITKDRKKKYRIISVIEWDSIKTYRCKYQEHKIWSYAFMVEWSEEILDGRYIAEWLEDLYEQIRNLSKFDKTTYPVMELQEDIEWKFYFLQYYRAKENNNLNTEQFSLNRDLELWEKEVNCVRWVTSPEWKIIEFKWYWEYLDDSIRFESTYWKEWFSGLVWKWAHLAIQTMFENDLFIEDFLPQLLEEWSNEKRFTFKNISWKTVSRYTVAQAVKIISYIQKEWFCIPIRIISDGWKAYVKIMMDFESFMKKFEEVTKNPEYPFEILNSRWHSRWSNQLDIFSNQYTIESVIQK